MKSVPTDDTMATNSTKIPVSKRSPFSTGVVLGGRAIQTKPTVVRTRPPPLSHATHRSLGRGSVPSGKRRRPYVSHVMKARVPSGSENIRIHAA